MLNKKNVIYCNDFCTDTKKHIKVIEPTIINISKSIESGTLIFKIVNVIKLIR